MKRRLYTMKWKIRNFVRKYIKGEYRAGEIIDLVFKKIRRNYMKEEIIFPKPVLALIADDSDYHRTRRGFMKYRSVIIISFGESEWIMGRGYAWGDYPAEPYDKDILVVELDDPLEEKSDSERVEEIMREVKFSGWLFKNSIIAAKSNGTFFVGKNWGDAMTKEINQEGISGFIKKKLENYDNYINVTVEGVVPFLKSSIKYDKELADFLSNKILRVLEK